MHRDGQDGRVAPERELGAVPVVDVPVDDRHPLEPTRLPRVHRRQSHVSEDAGAAPAIGLGMVARRADERVGVVDRAVQDGVHCGKAPAHGERRDLEGPAAERRGLAGVTAACIARRADPFDVLRRVEALQLLDGGGPRGIGSAEREHR